MTTSSPSPTSPRLDGMHGYGHRFAEGGQRSVQVGNGEDLLGGDRM